MRVSVCELSRGRVRGPGWGGGRERIAGEAVARSREKTLDGMPDA